MVDAIVLSGGKIESERFSGLGPEVGCKAQIPLLGRPMVEWVLEGLRSCPQIGRIVVVGPESLDRPALRELGASVTPEPGEIAENLRAGLDALAGAERVLALSGDLPLLTRAALEDFLSHAPEADLVYPYVERADMLREFPDRDWLFAYTPQGVFTGSSAALFRPDVLLANWAWVEAILDARRRQPTGLAMMIGPSFALKYLFRRLNVADVENKLSARLHLVGRGYQTRFTGFTVDVDRHSHIEPVECIMRQRRLSG